MRFFFVIFSFLSIQIQLLAQETYVMDTGLGDIVFAVYPEKAPITVSNFVKYVEIGDFNGANFYRVVRMDNQPDNDMRIEGVQGNFTREENNLGVIEHESTSKTGILHKNGTISMARLNPGTTSLAFFICINDQPALDYGGKRNPDGYGFAAFGKVIKGMDVVRKIQSGETEGQYLANKVVINSIQKKN